MSSCILFWKYQCMYLLVFWTFSFWSHPVILSVSTDCPILKIMGQCDVTWWCYQEKTIIYPDLIVTLWIFLIMIWMKKWNLFLLNATPNEAQMVKILSSKKSIANYRGSPWDILILPGSIFINSSPKKHSIL